MPYKMKTFTTFLNENITQKQLNAIESYADRLFRAVDIDVEFTRHFIDRVNDSRNKKQIPSILFPRTLTTKNGM